MVVGGGVCSGSSTGVRGSSCGSERSRCGSGGGMEVNRSSG